MKRREFISLSGTLGAGTILANKVKAFPFFNQTVLSASQLNDRCIVLIYLEGGNDGLNTVVPLNQYAAYANLRSTIKLAQSSLITLDGSLPTNKQLGLHPSLTKFKTLYDAGNLNIINGAGYPNPNLSHFRSRDLWNAGEDGNTTSLVNSGWAGRLLDTNFHTWFNNPSASFKDPLGIQLGYLDIALLYLNQQSINGSINLGMNSPGTYYTDVSEIGTQSLTNFPSSYYGNELQFIVGEETLANKYSQRISSVFNNGQNAYNSYPNSNLGIQLKTIARLLAGGCRTKIFLAQLTGFDSHVNQVISNSTSTGYHAGLLNDLSESMYAFQQDLQTIGIADRVLTCTYSEFGRRPGENASLGTDHGTLSTMFVMGGCVQGGVTGNNIDLSNLDSTGNPATLVNDYRQVFTTLMQDWLGASNSTVGTVGMTSFLSQKVSIIGSSCIVPPSQYIDPSTPLPELVAEAGRIYEIRSIARGTWYQQKLVNTFNDPVIVCGPFSSNDANPIMPRINNVSASGFQFNATEPDYLSGIHSKSEMCSYIAVEKGHSQMATGGYVEAGKTSGVTNTAITVNFDIGFATTPIVFAQVVTNNNSNVVWARVYNITTTGFTLKINAQKSNMASLSGEMVHWVAMETGAITLQNSLFAKMEIKKLNAAVGSNWVSLNFQNSYTALPPVLLAATQSNNDTDACLLRWQNATANGVQLMVQEDGSAGATTHAQEDMGILVFNYVNSESKFGVGNNASGFKATNGGLNIPINKKNK